MKYTLRNTFGLLAFVVLFLTACATTRVDAVWKNPSYQGHPSRILVISMAKSPVSRRIFEDEFVRQLNAQNVRALASYEVLPGADLDDQALVAKRMTEVGADAVLITRLASKKTVQVYVPGTPYYPPRLYGKRRDYYGYGYEMMYTPGYMTENEYAIMETNLYDAGNDDLIWAASSETGLLGSNRELIKSYIGVMVQSMSAEGLLDKGFVRHTGDQI